MRSELLSQDGRPQQDGLRKRATKRLGEFRADDQFELNGLFDETSVGFTQFWPAAPSTRCMPKHHDKATRDNLETSVSTPVATQIPPLPASPNFPTLRAA